MPKATTKNQLIKNVQKERLALEKLLAALTPEQMTQAKAEGEWSTKDVLAHLVEWETMVMKWYAAGVKGKTPAVPSEEFNWGQLPQLNHTNYLKYRNKPLEQVQREFKASYKKILQIIESIPEKELFTRGQYPWIRNNLLATTAHYR